MRISKESKILAKAFTASIDEQIRRGRLPREENEKTRSGYDHDPDMETAYQQLGIPRGGDSRVTSLVPAHYVPPIPSQYPLMQMDSGNNNKIVDHSLLRMSIENHYRRYDAKGNRETAPQLIWGAPGIGKSTGVKNAAIECAKGVAREKKMKFIIVDDPRSTELDKPLEELKQNFYFVSWNITKRSIKQKIHLGTPTSKNIAGVTQTAYDTKLKIPAENLFVFFDVRIAGIADSDILGVPARQDTKYWNEGETEVIYKPDLINHKLPFLEFCVTNPGLHGIIMWDEINQGSDGIQAALYSIILDRVVGDAPLPDGVMHCAAANGPIWAPNNKLKPALASRFHSSYLWVSPEEWLKTFDKVLHPALKKFITEKPNIAFYVTPEVFKEYQDRASARGIGVSDEQGQIEEPSYGKWPSPRDILAFNTTFKSNCKLAEDGVVDWKAYDIVEHSIDSAGMALGDVWSTHFRAFINKALSLKWDVLVVNPGAVEKAAGGKSADTFKALLADKFKEAYQLNLDSSNNLPDTAAGYKKLINELIKVCIPAAKVSHDAVQTPLSMAKRGILTSGAETEQKASVRLSQIIRDMHRMAPPGPVADAIEKLTHNLVKASGSDGGASKVGGMTSFASPDIQKDDPGSKGVPVVRPAPVIPQKEKEDEEVSDEENVKEEGKMFSAFNRIYEEISSMVDRPEPEAPYESPDETLSNQQIKGATNIMVEACRGIDKVSESRQQMDAINHAVLNDKILSPSQKQNLIGQLKTAPDPVNALLLIRAFTSPMFNLR